MTAQEFLNAEQNKLNASHEATRELVISKEKETGIFVDGYYTQFFELSQSGRAYKIVDDDDRLIYVACAACITDGNGEIFVPFTAIASARRFADRNELNTYIG